MLYAVLFHINVVKVISFCKYFGYTILSLIMNALAKPLKPFLLLLRHKEIKLRIATISPNPTGLSPLHGLFEGITLLGRIVKKLRFMSIIHCGPWTHLDTILRQW